MTNWFKFKILHIWYLTNWNIKLNIWQIKPDIHYWLFNTKKAGFPAQHDLFILIVNGSSVCQLLICNFIHLLWIVLLWTMLGMKLKIWISSLQTFILSMMIWMTEIPQSLELVSWFGPLWCGSSGYWTILIKNVCFNCVNAFSFPLHSLNILVDISATSITGMWH